MINLNINTSIKLICHKGLIGIIEIDIDIPADITISEILFSLISISAPKNPHPSGYNVEEDPGREASPGDEDETLSADTSQPPSHTVK